MISTYWNNNSDPYQYKNSEVLKNLPGIRDAQALEIFEQHANTLRLDEVLVTINSLELDLALWQVIHRILFQDIYAWAGEIRTVQLAKGGTVFAMPEHITAAAKCIFSEMQREDFASLERSAFILRLAYYFGELNILHPFREGNGRTQKLLFDEIARRYQYTIDWAKIGVDELLQALITAFHKHDHLLIAELFQKGVIKME